ncbi:MAG: sulfite exporter TauE/SafE family protein [Myxococcales bacterium]|nr:sulfite exporter TauE/SafE family protein [Myxococcales bacterium]
MWTLLSSVFLASLVGSLHCVGMCGGFVAFYAGDPKDGKSNALMAHVAYHGGRFLTYTTLGALAGLLGAGLNRMGAFAGFQHIAMYLSGSLLVVWGLFMLAQQSGYISFQSRLPVKLQRLVYTAYKKLQEQPNHTRAFWLGLLTTALPCGWLYAFVLSAASTGEPLAGALVMYAFWLGTVPALLGLGLGIRRLSLALGAWVPRLSAISLVVVGLFSFSQRIKMSLSPHAHKHHHHAPVLHTKTLSPEEKKRLIPSENPEPCIGGVLPTKAPKTSTQTKTQPRPVPKRGNTPSQSPTKATPSRSKTSPSTKKKKLLRTSMLTSP